MPLFLILLIVAVIVLAPLATIWSLNVLFGLGIAYTWKTWLAVLILGSALKANASSSKD